MFLQIILGWSLLSTIAATTIFAGGNTPLAWSFLGFAIVVLFVCQAAIDLSRTCPATFHRLTLPALLFLTTLCWGWLQTSTLLPDTLAHPSWAVGDELIPGRQPVVSADPASGQHSLLRLCAYAMAFWIAARAAGQATTAWALCRGFAIFAGLVAAFGLLSFFSGSNIVLGERAMASLSATFVNRNHYATFAVFGMLANLAAFMHASSRASVERANPITAFFDGFFTHSWVWLLGFLLCSGTLLVSQSRAGLVAALIGLSIFFLSTRNRGTFSIALPIFVTALIGVAVFATASAGVLDRILTASEENARFLVFPRIIDGIADRPLLGHGLGAFQDAFRAYVPPEAAFGEWDFAHNSYLENAFELGIPAAILFYIAIALIVVSVIRGLARRKRNRELPAFALAAAGAATFHAGFDFSLQMPAIAAVFAFILGLGFAQSFREEAMTESRGNAEARRLARG